MKIYFQRSVVFLFGIMYGHCVMAFSLPLAGTALFADSLGLRQQGGKLYIIHQVSAGETLASILKRYHTDEQAVKAANPSLKLPLVVNQQLLIPYLAGRANVVKHQVKPGETLFGLSRLYEMPIAAVKILNDLKSESLAAGQELLFYQKGKEGAPSETKEALVVIQPQPEPALPPTSIRREPYYYMVQQGDTYYKIAREANVPLDSLLAWNKLSTNNPLRPGTTLITSYYYYDNRGFLLGTTGTGFDPSKLPAPARPTSKETGVGGKIQQEKAHKNQFLALHPTLPYGTLLTVTNPSNQASIQVKVIGRLPKEIPANKDLIVLLSPAACQRLGILTTQFPIALEYPK
jgi:LysM repeat protein